MKDLIIIRHAKSSWKYQVTDFERPLKSRGLNDVALISNHVKHKIVKPNLILCSAAERTKMTAKIFIENLDFHDIDFQLDQDLYDFSMHGIMQKVKTCNDLVDTLMIFGHNYAITDFVNTFGSKYYDNIPTCGLIHIKFNIESWTNLNKGETIYSIFPKELK